MLLAPVLFLIAVALLFMRFFPLLLRFVSGESPALLHLVFAITAGALALAILVQEVGEGNVIGWLGPVVFLGALAGTYWATQRATHMRYVVAGFAIQSRAGSLRSPAGRLWPLRRCELLVAGPGVRTGVAGAGRRTLSPHSHRRRPCPGRFSRIQEPGHQGAGVAIDGLVAHGPQPNAVHLARAADGVCHGPGDSIDDSRGDATKKPAGAGPVRCSGRSSCRRCTDLPGPAAPGR